MGESGSGWVPLRRPSRLYPAQDATSRACSARPSPPCEGKRSRRVQGIAVMPGRARESGLRRARESGPRRTPRRAAESGPRRVPSRPAGRERAPSESGLCRAGDSGVRGRAVPAVRRRAVSMRSRPAGRERAPCGGERSDPRRAGGSGLRWAWGRAARVPPVSNWPWTASRGPCGLVATGTYVATVRFLSIPPSRRSSRGSKEQNISTQTEQRRLNAQFAYINGSRARPFNRD